MFTKEEKISLVQRFWIQFDAYCNTIPELAWKKKKWILHDTKISHVDLKFDPGRDFAMVTLEINHRSESSRLRIFELLEKYRLILEQGFSNHLTWDFCYLNINQQEVCRIYVKKEGLDLHRLSDWLDIHIFFAKNMNLLQENFLEIQEMLIEEVSLAIREE
ncbi:MAG: DUF4268 domain-containing protein [Mariniphaga sp.]